MQPSDVHRTRELEKENQRLKKIMAGPAIDPDKTVKTVPVHGI